MEKKMEKIMCWEDWTKNNNWRDWIEMSVEVSLYILLCGLSTTTMGLHSKFGTVHDCDNPLTLSPSAKLREH